jgi:hypothetical protein
MRTDRLLPIYQARGADILPLAASPRFPVVSSHSGETLKKANLAAVMPFLPRNQVIGGAHLKAGSRIGFIGPSRQVTHHAAKHAVTNHETEESTGVSKINRTPCARYGAHERPKFL